MGIASSVGLISGIDSRALIDQLLALDARPKLYAQQRITQLKSQQAAYLSVNTSLMALKNAAAKFEAANVFQSSSATSSDTEALTATASNSAAAGSYDFIVDRLVTTQRMLSRGFTDRDTSAFGATTLSFESSAAQIAHDTELSVLNGGAGIERGVIEITDRAGNAAQVDLSKAATVTDVLDAINSAEGAAVRASVDGDSFVIEDLSGGAGNLIVTDMNGRNTASDLGIAGSAAAPEITGTDVSSLGRSLSLAALNDGLGVLIKDGSTDFVITAKDGTKLNVDLGEQSALAIAEDATVDGVDYEAGTLTSDIAGWSGLDADEKPETEMKVTRPRAGTLGDVIDIINATAAEADGGAGVDVVASISGDGDQLVVTDNTTGGNLIIENGPSGDTAEALGLFTGGAGVAGNEVSSGRLVAGLNSVLTKSLNGGQGLSSGDVVLRDRDGTETTLSIDTTGSLSDIVTRLNDGLAADGNNLRVEINENRNGLKLVDSSLGSGAVNVSGVLADELRIAADNVSSSEIVGGSAQKAWIGRTTELSSLNNGRGVGTGKIRITDGLGRSSEVSIGSSVKTVDDLLRQLNSNGDVEVVASLNDTGDGIKLTDLSGASGSLRIEDVSGSVADKLNIAGTFDDEGADTVADGSFETRYEIGAGETLQDVVDRINADQPGVRAAVINDGSAIAPYRLSLTALDSGTGGRTIVDTGGLDIGLRVVDEGGDARVFFGSEDPADAVLLTSSSNTLDEVIDGVAIDLKQTTKGEVVTVDVARDTAAMEESVGAFVDAFNAVISTIDKYDKYTEETEQKGILLGDSTVRNIKNMLYRTIQQPGQDTSGSYQFLFQVGVKVGDGAKLEFDADRFRDALASDPAGVEDLFAGFELAKREPVQISENAFYTPTEDSYEKLGVAEQIELLVNNITNSIDGLLTNKTKSLDSQIELQNRRIEQFDKQLASKRSRLEQQFVAMEKALAQLQTQQQSLAQFPTMG